MDARIEAIRAALAEAAEMQPGAVERRLAASTAHLGIVARVIAPALGLAVLGAVARPWHLSEVWWQERLGGPVPLSVPDTPSGGTSGPPRVDGVAAASWLLDQILEPLTDAVAAAAAVSPRVLWGNVASAANTAARLVATARPELAAAAWEWAASIVDDHRLGTEIQAPGLNFRRSSCCLIYRLAPGATSICGDCVLGLRT